MRDPVLRSWRKLLFGLIGTLLLISVVGPPAFAHKEHRKEQASQAAATGPADVQAMHEDMGEKMIVDTDGSQMNALDRLLDWLGRTHPIVVHFPIAFFPAALFTAVVGRRRPAFAAPVQFLVVAGGILAPVSALLGWFSGEFALVDSDPLVTAHRWLGTAIGAGGLLMAIWAWRRPWEDQGAGMLTALSAMTLAIIVQGWFGGALVHGIDHLNW